VTEELDALVVELTRRGSPVSTLLLPGLAEEEVRSRLSAAGAQAHSDVVVLYAWHNGLDRFRAPVSSQGIVSLFPSYMEFNSLDESIETFADLLRIAQRLRDPEQVWSRSWFPVFKGGGSEWLFLNGQAGDEGSLWMHPIQDSPRRLYKSLSDAAVAVRQALIDGSLVLDSVGVFTRESAREAGLQI
jgi:hypothetical protein